MFTPTNPSSSIANFDRPKIPGACAGHGNAWFKPKGVIEFFLAIAMSFVFHFSGFSLACPEVGLAANQEYQQEDFPEQEQELDAVFKRQIQPLLNQFCSDCHQGENAEAEIDLQPFQSLESAKTQLPVWQKIRQVLSTNQMPPTDSKQLPLEQQQQLEQWVTTFLKIQARAHAGDPGPVILRRLSNDEYDYTIQDLTGVASLQPTRQFPVDSGAGEGFTNSGAAQGMSPAMVTKYLDAAKEVAQHAVLLPDGIEFSPHISRRDHSDQWIAKIQGFYRQHSIQGSGTKVDLQGVQFDTNQGGIIPIDKYLRATLEYRSQLLTGQIKLAEVAAVRALNLKYLTTLWNLFNGDSSGQSLWVKDLIHAWQQSTVDAVPELTSKIVETQSVLWKFNSVGQIGRSGGPNSWMQTSSNLQAQQEVRIPLSFPTKDPQNIFLAAKEFATHQDHLDNGRAPNHETEPSSNTIVWQNPRIEFADGKKSIFLKELPKLQAKIRQRMVDHLPKTRQYLDAVSTLRTTDESAEELAANQHLDAKLLNRWVQLAGFSKTDFSITGLYTDRLAGVNELPEINGWGSPATPSIITNASPETVSFSTLTLPSRGVFVHPSPGKDSVIVWQCPVQGEYHIHGMLADADTTCGNGVKWQLQLKSRGETSILSAGELRSSAVQEFATEKPTSITKGDCVILIVQSGNNDHVCDTTQVDFTLSQIDQPQKNWNLANDIVDRIVDANPLADSYGNSQVWHFCAWDSPPKQESVFSATSSLSQWRQAILNDEPADVIAALAQRITQVVSVWDNDSRAPLDPKDDLFRTLIQQWDGPLKWLEDAESPSNAGSLDFFSDSEQVLDFTLPAYLGGGATFVTTASIRGNLNNETQEKRIPNLSNLAFQIHASVNPILEFPFQPTAPILVLTDSAAQQNAIREMDLFCKVFPAALCYSRIVPVDEVVTLTLYHREDEPLQRLFLSDDQCQELDRLWNELLFVSQQPLLTTVVFEQISEFATQDRPDLVKAFATMRAPIYRRAEEFKQALLDSQASHLAAAKQFASLAWRRPLSAAEFQALDSLYEELRDHELSHDASFRLVLARILTSPAFVYKLEDTQDIATAVSISDFELATRLSYFLWSSSPDQELSQLAVRGELVPDQAKHGDGSNDSPTSLRLLEQTDRMLKDPRTKRMAIQFACQWLHVRNFDTNNDKNETLYPEFLKLRQDMYQETVMFFEDLFRNDGSILDIVDSDHTFVNRSLAQHYGFEKLPGDGWERIDGVRHQGRGGVLGMATILASQSGASRTSPILRGNWVSETLLGERLPKPPANVPTLPESLPAGLTARQLIQLHSQQPECAKCHVRIDPYGFALEQYDAVGRLRSQRVDTQTILFDGTSIGGAEQLKSYLSTQRRKNFVHQFCKKLLGFALGREVLLTDEPLLQDIQTTLAQSDYRFSVAVKMIVTSKQFLEIRGQKYQNQSRQEGLPK